MKIISPALHGVIDYLLVLFLWSSPTLFTLPDDTARITYLLGFAFLFFAVCTDNTSGIFRFFSMPLHGIIELVLSLIIIVLCYTELRYDERDRAFFLTFGVMLLVLFVVTDHTGTETVHKRVRGSARLRGPKTAA